MVRGRSKKKPVRDWDEKLYVSEQLLGAYSQRELADLVYDKHPVAAHQAYGNFRKWRKGSPTRSDGPKGFFDALAAALECPTATGPMLVEASIDEFIGYLPEKHTANAQTVLRRYYQAQQDESDVAEPGLPDDVPALPSIVAGDIVRPRHLRFMTFHAEFEVPSIRDGIKVGRINQEHYYLTPDAAATWHHLVRADGYPTYDQCKWGIRDLVESETWKSALADVQPNSVVMLAGGGAPTKDIVLLNSLLSQEYLSDQRLTYFLLDVSSYMLKASVDWLHENLQDLEDPERVEIKPHWQDMLKLDGCDETFRRDSAILFAITGGTIGNVSELAFFRSLNSISRNGDLLILSADTIEDVPSDDVEGELRKKYDHQAMRRFIAPSVHAMLGQLDLGETMDSLFERVQVTIEAARPHGLSDVDESYAVTLWVELTGRRITLLSSTRYRPSTLVEFVGERGWDLVDAVPSPLNKRFIQFLFRCRKSGEITDELRTAA